MSTARSEQEIKDTLITYEQDHILRYLEMLTPEEQQSLLQDVSCINFPQLSTLYQAHRTNTAAASEKNIFDPADILAPPFSNALYSTGEDCLQAGKVGIFLVAGGQGTRLGFKGPKGCYPVSPVKQKSLFQLFAESIRALQHRYGTRLFWYIMTSPENNQETSTFFRQNNFFGLTPDQIRFIIQGEIPSLDGNGKLLLDRNKKIFKNPDGHGGSLSALKESGALDDMRAKGIEEIFYFQVDNPLAKIADPLFIGAHVAHNADMSTKVVKKTDPEEKVGIIGKINGKLGCIEYSELSAEEINERTGDGSLRFSSANIAIHMIRRSFAEKLTSGTAVTLPFHSAQKEIECLNIRDGKLVPDTVSGLKFEMFIFDALGYARNPVTMEVNRAEEFSPVKNSAGVDSPATAQQSMVKIFTQWVKNSGSVAQLPDNLVIEISPLFALDEDEFKKKCTSLNPPATALYLGP
jgi:UDP-N-acetylglucosamine/UDP-N-acetylgalactosamine diphosphorylase